MAASAAAAAAAATARPLLQDRQGKPSSLYTSNPPPCPAAQQPRTKRRVPQHFCGMPNCCVAFSGEGDFRAKGWGHLPCCHSSCWRRERERVVVDVGVGVDELPGCHRGCYLRALRALHDGVEEEWVRDVVSFIEPVVKGECVADAEILDQVPLNRSLGEMCRVPQLQHRFARWLSKADDQTEQLVPTTEHSEDRTDEPSHFQRASPARNNSPSRGCARSPPGNDPIVARELRALSLGTPLSLLG